jgi:alkylhydroperoxidase/carboxymuconolactone decarboxylase family protein YurZ
MTDHETYLKGLEPRRQVLGDAGILAALGRFQEVGIYTNGALACGVTVDEIRDALVHVTAYCGAPAGRQAFTAAHEALVAAGALTGEAVGADTRKRRRPIADGPTRPR